MIINTKIENKTLGNIYIYIINEIIFQKMSKKNKEELTASQIYIKIINIK